MIDKGQEQLRKGKELALLWKCDLFTLGYLVLKK